MNQKYAFVAAYCPASGEADLISVPHVNDTTALKGMMFAFWSDKEESVWVYGMDHYLKIDDPVRKLLVLPGRRIVVQTPSKQIILCAFSTPECALTCLAHWVATKGESDLPAE